MESAFPGIGVLTTDQQLVIRSWNDWLATATGLSEGSVQGRSLPDLVPPQDREALAEVLSEVLGTGSARVLAASFHRFLIPCHPRTPSRHFEQMQQRVTVAPLTTGGGVAGVMVTIEDVTARRDRERALAERLEAGDAGASQEAMIAAAGSEDWRVRGVAVRALKESAGREELAHLLETLRRDHHDLNVLSSALQVLVAADRDVAGPLGELLSDPNPNLRMHAALALGELNDPQAVPGLVAALDDEDQNVRFHAIEALGRMRAAPAVEPLARIAGSGDFFLSFPAIDALARIDDPGVVPSLIDLVEQDLLRPAVVDALAALGDEDCVMPLVQRLNAGDADPAAIAAALVRIHARYEDAYGAGLHIVGLSRSVATADGIARLSAAVEKRKEPLAPLVVVLGWMGADGLPALVGSLGGPGIEAPLADAILQLGGAAVDPVVERLMTGGRETRLAAAALLGRLGDRRATPALIETLSGADAELATTAAASLASLGDPRALDALLPLFAHEQAVVRQAAIAAVNSIGADGTAARVRVRITDRDPHVRECAIRVAAYFGFEGCAAGIVQALNDEHEDVRRAAIEQLPILDDERALAHLLTVLREETPRNRGAAARALRSVADADVEAPLLAALEDADAWVRYFAAEALAVHGRDASVTALARAVAGDRAPHVRIAALRALGSLDPGAISGLAAPYVEDEDADVACAALGALARATTAEADTLLEQGVQASRVQLRSAAVDALAVRCSARAPEILAWAARAPDPGGAQDAAVEGLRRIAASDGTPGQARALAMLLELGNDPAGRELSVAAIARLPPQVIDELALALSSPHAGIRRAVVEGLARMRHNRASDALLLALADEDASVRNAAVGAFGRLGTPRAARAVSELRQSDPDPAVRRHAAAVCRRHGWNIDSSRVPR